MALEKLTLDKEVIKGWITEEYNFFEMNVPFSYTAYSLEQKRIFRKEKKFLHRLGKFLKKAVDNGKLSIYS